MKLVLPEPPSINRYWRNFRGRMVISADGRAYKLRVWAENRGQKALEGPLSVSIRWYRGRRSGDLDNRAKVTLDALLGVAYLDDKQIVELHMWRHEDKASPRVEVDINAA